MGKSTELLSLPRLIAWLEQQEPDARYDSTDCETCLFAKYFQSIDPEAKPTKFEGSWVYTVGGARVDVEILSDIAIRGGRSTFGGALKRAREMLGDR